MNFNIILVHPRIPPNTGNIGRLCAATRSTLHLVKPLGFRVDDREMKRAGLDYWDELDWKIHDNWQTLLETEKPSRMFYLSKFGGPLYSQIEFQKGDYLVFGSETHGLPEEIKNGQQDKTLRIPIFNDNIRSLNLANSVAIVLYEAIRQTQ